MSATIAAATLSEIWWRELHRLCPDLAAGAADDSSLDADGLADHVPPAVKLQAWASALDVPFQEHLRSEKLLPQFVQRVPISFARRYLVAALSPSDEASAVPVALGSLKSWSALDLIGRHLRRPVAPRFVPEDQILAALNAAYSDQGERSQLSVSGLAQRESEAGDADLHIDLLDSTDRSPVVKLVNSILFDAIRARASDVHVQPQEERVVVRQRIDGILFDALFVPKEYQDEVISRLKVLGRMNIAEKRLPQDGRASVEVGDRFIDLRIASLPTSFGERVVVRFLDKGARLYTLEELGMAPTTLAQFRELIRLEHGLLLVTGPTGSGKSTTLYSAISEINSKDLNVLTLEDPIEYRLEGVSQTQINTKKGLTFASGLRNVLRQDPDVIMVGEIRDHETAVMAIQSALTGHLVFSTLHTNDAASAITRLLDLGIEPFLAASSVVGVVAQRLVRRICPQCRTVMETHAEQLVALPQWVNEGGFSVYRGAGCKACRQTGYSGRVGVFELLEMNDAVRQLIQNRANSADIRATAQRDGLVLLREDAIDKVRAGQTTLEEVLRVTARL